MITRITPINTTSHWRQELAEAINDPKKLIDELQLDPKILPDLQAGHQSFRIKVPRSFLKRMESGNPKDPLLLQALPQLQEIQPSPHGYSEDPVGDQTSSPTPGLIHKYQGRILLITSPACAIHCRYCFRRNYPYQDVKTNKNDWQAALEYIKNDTSITEVILSGGDPLTLPDSRLASLAQQLEKIQHLKILRIHTRLPVVLPARVDQQLCQWIQNTRLTTVMVIHANHPQELDSSVAKAMQQLSKTGIHLFNQTVLLAGINDDPAILTNLSKKLFSLRIQPYYLHLLDRVTGSGHFEVPAEKAKTIYHDLCSSLPGYLVPKLVRDQAQSPAKSIAGNLSDEKLWQL